MMTENTYRRLMCATERIKERVDAIATHAARLRAEIEAATAAREGAELEELLAQLEAVADFLTEAPKHITGEVQS